MSIGGFSWNLNIFIGDIFSSIPLLRNGNINEKIEVFQILQENTRKRMQFLNLES